MDETVKRGMGWLPDLPDFRDYTVEHQDIKPMLEKAGVAEPRETVPIM